MNEVEVTRFVRATPLEIERALSPAALIEHEGSFSVRESRETPDRTIVTATGGGMELVYEFTAEKTGFTYEQRQGPLAHQRTTLTYEAANEGTRIRTRSTVATGTSLAVVTDRLAAWKRRGELKRALDSLAASVE